MLDSHLINKLGIIWTPVKKIKNRKLVVLVVVRGEHTKSKALIRSEERRVGRV